MAGWCGLLVGLRTHQDVQGFSCLMELGWQYLLAISSPLRPARRAVAGQVEQGAWLHSRHKA